MMGATSADAASFGYVDISPALREVLARGGTRDAPLSLAGSAGSGRAYYRVHGTGLVLLVSPDEDADFGRFLRITQFYRMLRVPVPRVHAVDDAARQVLLEDLGERRLYDVLKSDRAAGLGAYQKALAILADLQGRCDPFRDECPDIKSRVFDTSQLLWETGYYRAHYLEAYRGLRPAPAMQEAFDRLAARVDTHPKVIMHRDFQSQNLMVKPDESVHVIDYQGSRLGSMFYDAASLLLDPYVMLADDEIEGLLRGFHAARGGGTGFSAFRTAFLEAGLQRVMQALGAYCFLSRVKGLAAFADHIPAGEERLRWLVRETGGDWKALLPD